jgi:hypothetical protein
MDNLKSYIKGIDNTEFMKNINLTSMGIEGIINIYCKYGMLSKLKMIIESNQQFNINYYNGINIAIEYNNVDIIIYLLNNPKVKINYDNFIYVFDTLTFDMQKIILLDKKFDPSMFNNRLLNTAMYNEYNIKLIKLLMKDERVVSKLTEGEKKKIDIICNT